MKEISLKSDPQIVKPLMFLSRDKKMKVRTLFGWCLTVMIWLTANLSHAQSNTEEHISRMDVTISTLKDGSIRIREEIDYYKPCLLYTSPSPRDRG